MQKKAEKILNSTIVYLVRHGVAKATMDDMARHANVSKVTIYKYFTDKDMLYLKMAEYLFSKYIDRMTVVLESGDGLVKKLYTFMDIIGEFSLSGQYKLCEELCACNVDTQAEYNRYLRSYHMCLSSLIDQGFSQGVLKEGLNQGTVFHYINMGIVYFQENAEYRHQLTSDAQFRQHFMLFHISHIFIDSEKIFTTV